MQRLEQLAGQVKETKFLADGLEFYKLYDMLTDEERHLGEAMREFAQKEVYSFFMARFEERSTNMSSKRSFQPKLWRPRNRTN